MRKLALVAMAFAIIMLMSGPASAARIDTQPYGSPAIGQGDVLSGCFSGEAPLNSCVVFPVALGETSVTVTINDDSGDPTYGTIGQDVNNDGFTDVSTNFCTTSPVFELVNPVPLGETEVIVFVHAAPGLGQNLDEPCLGVGTSGTVTATFN